MARRRVLPVAASVQVGTFGEEAHRGPTVLSRQAARRRRVRSLPGNPRQGNVMAIASPRSRFPLFPSMPAVTCPIALPCLGRGVFFFFVLFTSHLATQKHTFSFFRSKNIHTHNIDWRMNGMEIRPFPTCHAWRFFKIFKNFILLSFFLSILLFFPSDRSSFRK